MAIISPRTEFSPTRVALHCIIVVLAAGSTFRLSAAAGNVLASFVFGDSLVDAGNNNYILTLSKANIRPNGIDFSPSGGAPTGRYTNGRIIPDLIGQELGLGKNSFAPPYLAPSTKGSAILHGVNYASGGSGILNDTGRIFVGRLPLDTQIDYFEQTREQLTKMLGPKAAKELLQQSIFSITMGSNDFLNNYLVPGLSTVQRAFVSPDAFIDRLINTFGPQLQRLYKLDARKIVVANVGPLGCTPYQRTVNRVNEDQCASTANQLALKFNSRLKDLVLQLNADSPGATFVYADTYGIVTDIIKNHAKYGFVASNTACCGSGGEYRGIIPCGPTTTLCSDHTKYVFWDPYHPSEAANLIFAKRLLDGGPEYMFPINVRQLVSL